MTLELRNEPKQARSTATLARLTLAATEVAEEIGIDRFTTADVACRAGVSIGTVYRYFDDRLALVEAIDPERHIGNEVREERRRQDAKWGQQNHPDGTGPYTNPLRRIDSSSRYSLAMSPADELASAATDATDCHAAAGDVTWLDILLEEVFEAAAESDPTKLRTELVQVMAVAQQWIAAIDRRTA